MFSSSEEVLEDEGLPLFRWKVVPKVHRIYFYVVIVTSIKDAFRKTISWTLVEKKGKNEILNTESFHVLYTVYI